MSIVRIGNQDVWVDDDSEIIIAEVRGFPVVELSGHALRQMEIRDVTKDRRIAKSQVLSGHEFNGLPDIPGQGVGACPQRPAVLRVGAGPQHRHDGVEQYGEA